MGVERKDKKIRIIAAELNKKQLKKERGSKR